MQGGDLHFSLQLEVRAAESWQIELLPLTSALHEAVPGIIEGTGDDVALFQGSEAPDLLNADASTANGIVVVWAFGDAGALVINDVAPYVGTVPLPRDATAIAIKASGPWRLEVTTRQLSTRGLRGGGHDRHLGEFRALEAVVS